MAEFTIFYSWQSDRDSKTTRYLIRDAIKDAIDALAADTDLAGLDQPVLDHDTKGVSGTPIVTEAILDKISKCGIFLADVSFVSTIEPEDGREPKLAPNPNVLLELGYAASYVGWERIILVMNTDYGGPKELPFDLGHRRHPIQYNLASGASADDVKTQRKELSGIIRHAVKTVMQSVVLNAAAPNVNGSGTNGKDPLAIAEDTRQAFIDDLRRGEFYKLSIEPGCIGLITVPIFKPNKPLAIAENEDMVRSWLKPLMKNGSYTGRLQARKYYTTSEIQQDPNADKLHLGLCSASEITIDGVIRSASKLITFIPRQDQEAIDERYIPSFWFEKESMMTIINHLNLMKNLGVAGPWLVSIFMLNLPPVYMEIGINYFQNSETFTEKDIIPNFVEIPKDATGCDIKAISPYLKPIYDFIWRDFGYRNSYNYDDAGIWVGQR